MEAVRAGSQTAGLQLISSMGTQASDSSSQGFKSASGVVLRRTLAGEGDLSLTLFLREKGMLRLFARGAATGKVRFGGGSEPLVWGAFKYYQGRGGGLYLESVDIADDMFSLRHRREGLFAAVRWVKLLMRFLPAGHTADDLLAGLYWNMKLLGNTEIPVEAADWRFFWRWLKGWGLAPDLSRCGLCGEASASLSWTPDGLVCSRCSQEAFLRFPVFSSPDFAFLRSVAEMSTSEIETFKERAVLWSERKLFALACRCLEGFLVEI